MTPARRLIQRIVATTDVHSAFDTAVPMLAYLHAARQDGALVVDCGDFFEGTGYYRLGRGRIERDILLRLYDVIAPGNHGWPHYFEPGLHRITVCANAVDSKTGKPLFPTLRLIRVGPRRVAVTGIISPQAFNAIPVGQRAGHHVLEPVGALRELLLAHHHEVDSWVVLSHSGFDEDLGLAKSCPFLDVVFAGHCHSDRPAPVRVGDTVILKGRELATGYALVQPLDTSWASRVADFPPASVVPQDLYPFRRSLASWQQKLRLPLGTLRLPYRKGPLDRRALAWDLVERLHHGPSSLGAEVVVLNETAFRSPHLGTTLSQGDLLAIEPFGNDLVHAHVPDPYVANPAALLTHLAERAGPIVSAPFPLPDRMPIVLTTSYLADAYVGGRIQRTGTSLSQAVQRTLTDGESR
ncbi:bifunctional metallophosphatase/5'-nucleotidase [Streptomyces sp. NPDC046203]|uniref:bifunctional metallophosphatase/5'-nucleotidase n=1 Tax=Streptomyces sp. NPDC046203 TaxID=3154602 RepID=UPI0033D13F63